LSDSLIYFFKPDKTEALVYEQKPNKFSF